MKIEASPTVSTGSDGGFGEYYGVWILIWGGHPWRRIFRADFQPSTSIWN
ncbi:hypothetical protein KC19_VG331700 [Ceratodon purpureus]|uniref:Uncharacterized protein n=1 Tax=Ceratodon purpureus TaxID=3225 RepID=A0A8T0HX69_CERPU|nr:hypothetical protein KC19_VG331700 [Ceratodon purpureus]